MDSIRVLLANDHPVVRAGIKAELDGADGIEVVGEASICAPWPSAPTMRTPSSSGSFLQGRRDTSSRKRHWIRLWKLFVQLLVRNFGLARGCRRRW